MHARIKSIPELLEKRLAPPNARGCRLWLGSIRGDGYGRFKVGGKTLAVHRVVWQLANGISVPPGCVVCHHCDTPLCGEISHLFVGTPADNNADKVAKGRSLRGAANPNAKLSAEHVAEMRALYSTGGFSQCELARKFGVGKSMAGYILRNEDWKDWR